MIRIIFVSFFNDKIIDPHIDPSSFVYFWTYVYNNEGWLPFPINFRDQFRFLIPELSIGSWLFFFNEEWSKFSSWILSTQLTTSNENVF